MIQSILNSFRKVPMTVLSGFFLLTSLILMLAGKEIFFDPAWGCILISGTPMAEDAVKRIFYQKRISSAFLVSVAMAACVAIGETFAAGEVAFIMALGEILENFSISRARKGLKKLVSLTPTQGRLLKSGPDFTEKMMPVEEIQCGDILRVLPGETVPVDGKIVSGNTSINQSVLTGESLPVNKAPGDSVFSGTINEFGTFDFQASKTGANSSLQQLIRLVENAEKKKAPTQRIADRWAEWLVPAALILAVAVYFATSDIRRSITVLVVFCPCALVLATPTSIAAAIGQAAKFGIIIKSGEALEKMGQINCATFDKTGTLTFGNLVVSDVVPANAGVTPDEVIRLAAAAEIQSEHPIGKSVVKFAQEKGILIPTGERFQMVPGKGISIHLDETKVFCGTEKWLAENGVFPDETLVSAQKRLTLEGKALIFAADTHTAIGIIALSDTLRPGVQEMVRSLQSLNVESILLTGDHTQTARYFADLSGVQEVHAELLPFEKFSFITKLQKEGKKVCMIGDGVNDALALKTAGIGVAMGVMGSDLAVEAAEIALTDDDLSKIPYLKRLSNAVIRCIQFNITLSMLINATAIIMAVNNWLNPISGALVHNLGSFLVVLNAALLYDRKL